MKTTLTMDVASSPDTLVPCNNPVCPVQLVEELRHKTGRSGFHSRYGPWKFSTDLTLLSACSSPGYIQLQTEMDTEECISLGVKCGQRVELTAVPS